MIEITIEQIEKIIKLSGYEIGESHPPLEFIYDAMKFEILWMAKDVIKKDPDLIYIENNTFIFIRFFPFGEDEKKKKFTISDYPESIDALQAAVIYYIEAVEKVK